MAPEYPFNPTDARVSNNRSGTTGAYADPAGNQPLRSATRSVPAFVYRQTLPPAPILVITKFGAVPPAVKFKFDAFVRGCPHGHTVTKPSALAPVPVTFNTTARA